MQYPRKTENKTWGIKFHVLTHQQWNCTKMLISQVSGKVNITWSEEITTLVLLRYYAAAGSKMYIRMVAKMEF